MNRATITHEHLSSYTRVKNLGLGTFVYFVIKDENDVAKKPDRLTYTMGGEKFEELRTVSQGFVGFGPLLPKISEEEFFWKYHGEEPRGVAGRYDITVIGFVDRLHVISTKDCKLLKEITNENFRNIHSINFKKNDPKIILVCSTGSEVIQEIDITTGLCVWEWSPWDHGYNSPRVSGVKLFRKCDPLLPVKVNNREQLSYSDYLKYKNDSTYCPTNDAVVVGGDDLCHQLGLEKCAKAVDPNWAMYTTGGDDVLATFLNAGLAVSINKTTGKVTELLTNLKKPHGLIPFDGGYLVSNTEEGTIVIIKKNHRTEVHIPSSNSSKNWIQNTLHLGRGLLASINDTDKKIYVIDFYKKQFNCIEYPEKYKLQAIRTLFTPLEGSTEWWERLNFSFTG